MPEESISLNLRSAAGRAVLSGWGGAPPIRAASPGFSLTSGLCPAFSPASASGLWLDAADEAQPIVDISCMKEKKLKRYVGNNTPP